MLISLQWPVLQAACNGDQRCHGSVLIINLTSPESTLQGPLKRIISSVSSTDGMCSLALRSEVKVNSGFHLRVKFWVELVLYCDADTNMRSWGQTTKGGLWVTVVCLCCRVNTGTILFISFMSTGHVLDLFGKGALS